MRMGYYETIRSTINGMMGFSETQAKRRLPQAIIQKLIKNLLELVATVGSPVWTI